jgi:hypothetical protein
MPRLGHHRFLLNPLRFICWILNYEKILHCCHNIDEIQTNFTKDVLLVAWSKTFDCGLNLGLLYMRRSYYFRSNAVFRYLPSVPFSLTFIVQSHVNIYGRGGLPCLTPLFCNTVLFTRNGYGNKPFPSRNLI